MSSVNLITSKYGEFGGDPDYLMYGNADRHTSYNYKNVNDKKNVVNTTKNGIMAKEKKFEKNIDNSKENSKKKTEKVAVNYTNQILEEKKKDIAFAEGFDIKTKKADANEINKLNNSNGKVPIFVDMQNTIDAIGYIDKVNNDFLGNTMVIANKYNSNYKNLESDKYIKTDIQNKVYSKKLINNIEKNTKKAAKKMIGIADFGLNVYELKKIGEEKGTNSKVFKKKSIEIGLDIAVDVATKVATTAAIATSSTVATPAIIAVLATTVVGICASSQTDDIAEIIANGKFTEKIEKKLSNIKLDYNKLINQINIYGEKILGYAVDDIVKYVNK